MNEIVKVGFKKLPHCYTEKPFYQTAGSSGMDLYASGTHSLKPMERCLVECGFTMVLPDFLEAQIRPRSGLALKKGITVLNSPGTIDSDYRGEIKVLLINLGTEDFLINRGERIAQMVIAPVQKISWKDVDNIDVTERAEGGFGHTGV